MSTLIAYATFYVNIFPKYSKVIAQELKLGKKNPFFILNILNY